MFGLSTALVTLIITPGGKDVVGGSGSKESGYVWEELKENMAMMEPFNTHLRTTGNSVPVQVNCTCPGQNGPDDEDGSDVNSKDV